MMVPLIRRVIETIFSLTCFSAAIGIGLAASITDADVNNTTLPAHSYLLLGTCQSDIASFKRKYDHTLWCPPWETNVTYNHYADYQLHVIYFLNTKIHNGYGGWMKEQLKYVPPSAALKIVSVAYDCENETIMQDMYRHLVASRNGSTLLECHDEAERETFEYHGIHAMWEIGQVNSGRDDIVFYFHSKGLTHYKEWKDYEANDNLFKLTEKTLGEVDLVFEVFDLFPEVDKVGNKMSELGWVWYNFMFARGSYLKRVAEPIISSNRHYYEAWIANVVASVWGMDIAIVPIILTKSTEFQTWEHITFLLMEPGIDGMIKNGKFRTLLLCCLVTVVCCLLVFHFAQYVW
ncbi:hypothetical protein ACHAWC_005136 [Mediolabrus comicus]